MYICYAVSDFSALSDASGPTAVTQAKSAQPSFATFARNTFTSLRLFASNARRTSLTHETHGSSLRPSTTRKPSTRSLSPQTKRRAAHERSTVVSLRTARRPSTGQQTSKSTSECISVFGLIYASLTAKSATFPLNGKTLPFSTFARCTLICRGHHES